jgi:asparaginyl-tRNA synthetase
LRQVGGGQREERLALLRPPHPEAEAEAEAGAGAGKADGGRLEWYGDLRRYGTVPHAGWGAGFDRLVQFATGKPNIRDVVAFPRTRCGVRGVVVGGRFD